MKIRENCYSSHFVCPFLRWGCHSGFTGKSGEATWCRCLYHGSPAYLRYIQKCGFATIKNRDKQKDAWIRFQKGDPC